MAVVGGLCEREQETGGSVAESHTVTLEYIVDDKLPQGPLCQVIQKSLQQLTLLSPA